MDRITKKNRDDWNRFSAEDLQNPFAYDRSSEEKPDRYSTRQPFDIIQRFVQVHDSLLHCVSDPVPDF